jgi:hypothetical protein
MLQSKFQAQHMEAYIKKLRKGDITEEFRQQKEWKPSANGSNISYKREVLFAEKPKAKKSKSKGRKKRPKSAGTKSKKIKINRDISISSGVGQRKTRGVDVYTGSFEQRMAATPKEQP